MPIYAFAAMAVMIICATLAVIFVPPQNNSQLLLLVGLIVSSIPTLLAAAFSERVSRDVRNGTMVAKAKEGATQALDESGITAVAKSVNPQQTSEALATAVTALHALLIHVTPPVPEAKTVAAEQNPAPHDP